MKPTLLLVDDDQDALVSLARALGSHLQGISIVAATSEESAFKQLGREFPNVSVIDLSLNPREGVESGFRLLKKLKASYPESPVLMLTGHGGEIQYGVRALEEGASSFLQKPPDILHLAALIKDSLRQNEILLELKRLQESRKHELSAAVLIGSSKGTESLREELEFAASSPQAVYISGETGVGKGLVAGLIHRLSKRSKEPFIRFQTSFGGADLVKSELFGHVKGAFTGADTERKGLIEEARAGTLFLDEIDTLPKETQISLLGTLQDKRIRPVGSNEEVAVDFRLISASNRPLYQCVEEKDFREDLFHRVAQVKIEIPPLRERREDIPLLAEYRLSKLKDEEELSVAGFSEGALHQLSLQDWPGNIRELFSAVDTAAFYCQFKRDVYIDVKHIEQREVLSKELSFKQRVEDYKLTLVTDALKKAGGNQVHAAKELGIDRHTLRRILAKVP